MSATLLATLAMGLKKPKQLSEVNVNVGEEYAKTAKENIGLVPSLTELAKRTNEAMQTEYLKSMERMVPGVRGLIDKGTVGIDTLLSGKLPADVEAYTARKGAEYGAAAGTGTSSFTGAKTARDLGLTSLQMFGQGLNAAQSWIALSKSMPTFDFTSMMINPQFRTQLKLQQEMYNTQIRKYNTVLKSMPEPWQQEVLNSTRALDSIIANTAQSVLSSYTGGMMGGGGIGGAGGGAGGGGGGGGSPGSVISRGTSYSPTPAEPVDFGLPYGAGTGGPLAGGQWDMSY